MKNENNQENKDNGTTGPGQLYHLGLALGDIYLAHPQVRSQIVGRPLVYVALDDFSRLIAGVYVSYGPPSGGAVLALLRNTFMDKVALCGQLKFEIDEAGWPSKGLPQRISTDRAEFYSALSNELVARLGIQWENCARRRINFQRIIEQIQPEVFGHEIRWQTVGPASMPAKTVEFHPAKSHPVTTAQFHKDLLRRIMDYNASLQPKLPLTAEMIAVGVARRPIELWSWGIANRTGSLRELDPETFPALFLPAGEATVTRKGVYFRGLEYSSPAAMQEGWFERAQVNGLWKVKVYYDPQSVNRLYVCGEDHRCEITLELTEACKGFRGWTWAEHHANRRESRRKEADENSDKYLLIQSAVQEINGGAALAKPIKPKRSVRALDASDQDNVRDAIKRHVIGTGLSLRDAYAKMIVDRYQDKIMRPTFGQFQHFWIRDYHAAAAKAARNDKA